MYIEIRRTSRGYELHHSMKSPLDDWPTVYDTKDALESAVTHLIRYWVKNGVGTPQDEEPRYLPEDFFSTPKKGST